MLPGPISCAEGTEPLDAEQRRRKTERQRARRAQMAREAGREPGQTGRPPTGTTPRTAQSSRSPEARRRERSAARVRADAHAVKARREQGRERDWSATNARRADAKRAWRLEHLESERVRGRAKERRRQAAKLQAEARAYVLPHVKPDGRELYQDPLYDDALSVAVLGILVRKSWKRTARAPHVQAEVIAYVKAERSARGWTNPDYALDSLRGHDVDYV